MRKAKIVEKAFNFFSPLSKRTATNRIIIHHTGGADIDAYAEQIHNWHVEMGYSGIGYHFVIRKNGEIERGRPVWAVGSHAFGANFDSIGIHLSGDFTYNSPTNLQIESLALLIANLCAEYNIPIDRKHILGHRETVETSCPGNVLFNLLEVIVGKAAWYRYGGADILDTPADKDKLIFKPRAGMLSEHFAENEFTCPHCGKLEIEPRLIELLEQLRFNIGGYPLLIKSGYRCNATSNEETPELNQQHAQGKAADVYFPRQLSFGEFKWYIERLPFDNVTYFKKWVHISVSKP